MTNTLYLGLDPSRFPGEVVHFPIIEIQPREGLEQQFEYLPQFDFVIFTSRSAVSIYAKYARCSRPAIVVGKATAKLCSELNIELFKVADLEQAEGVLEILKVTEGSFFFPHSSSARPLLLDYLMKREAHAFIAYDTLPTKKRIDIEPFDRFIFTSPSTVHAFVEIFGYLPKKKLVAIGPITKKELKRVQILLGQKAKRG
ncbi:MAG: hypothetical protein S4CHLAM81_06960 [Chlamydiales bacterium]|nr:hypothetical protein [Chlamydiales bacterium]MCH9635480.1 hypothetical protein [Chlamydiales bacterium]